MEIVINLVLHLDKYLGQIIQQFGAFTYVILFLVVFAETGFVVTPFLPGDSLIFVAATLSSQNFINPIILYLTFVAAAILGDTINYWIGHYLGPKVFSQKKSRFFNPEHLHKTQKFFDKYGGKTIIIARFIPIVRTFAPFVAGIGSMQYGQFILYNIVGGILWVSVFMFAGYFLGTLPIVQENFHIAIFAIIGLSLLPPIIEIWKSKCEKHRPVTPVSDPQE
jgi:membrane-associated protein